jgi:hypothetical protein
MADRKRHCIVGIVLFFASRCYWFVTFGYTFLVITSFFVVSPFTGCLLGSIRDAVTTKWQDNAIHTPFMSPKQIKEAKSLRPRHVAFVYNLYQLNAFRLSIHEQVAVKFVSWDDTID